MTKARKKNGLGSAGHTCSTDADCNGGLCFGVNGKEGEGLAVQFARKLKALKESAWFGTYGGVGSCDGM